MFFKFLILQKAVLYTLIILFANRAWNYFDKLSETGFEGEMAYQLAVRLIITVALFCFFLGFAVCLEVSSKVKKVQNNATK